MSQESGLYRLWQILWVAFADIGSISNQKIREYSELFIKEDNNFVITWE